MAVSSTRSRPNLEAVLLPQKERVERILAILLGTGAEADE